MIRVEAGSPAWAEIARAIEDLEDFAIDDRPLLGVDPLLQVQVQVGAAGAGWKPLETAIDMAGAWREPPLFTVVGFGTYDTDTDTLTTEA